MDLSLIRTLMHLPRHGVRILPLVLQRKMKIKGSIFLHSTPAWFSLTCSPVCMWSHGYEDKLKAFPMVIRLLAKPAEIPARKVAWLASSATDNMTGKVIQIPFVGQAIFVFLQVLIAKIFNQKLPPVDIHIEVCARCTK